MGNFEGLVLEGAAIDGLPAGACNAEQSSAKWNADCLDGPLGLIRLGTADNSAM